MIHSKAYDETCRAFDEQAIKEIATAQRDPGATPAERIVLNALRKLRDLPPREFDEAGWLIHEVSFAFVNAAYGLRNEKRRAEMLLRVASEKKAGAGRRRQAVKELTR